MDAIQSPKDNTSRANFPTIIELKISNDYTQLHNSTVISNINSSSAWVQSVRVVIRYRTQIDVISQLQII